MQSALIGIVLAPYLLETVGRIPRYRPYSQFTFTQMAHTPLPSLPLDLISGFLYNTPHRSSFFTFRSSLFVQGRLDGSVPVHGLCVVPQQSVL
jgi:hypothetical protein